MDAASVRRRSRDSPPESSPVPQAPAQQEAREAELRHREGPLLDVAIVDRHSYSLPAMPAGMSKDSSFRSDGGDFAPGDTATLGDDAATHILDTADGDGDDLEAPAPASPCRETRRGAMEWLQRIEHGIDTDSTLLSSPSPWGRGSVLSTPGSAVNRLVQHWHDLLGTRGGGGATLVVDITSTPTPTASGPDDGAPLLVPSAGGAPLVADDVLDRSGSFALERSTSMSSKRTQWLSVVQASHEAQRARADSCRTAVVDEERQACRRALTSVDLLGRRTL